MDRFSLGQAKQCEYLNFSGIVMRALVKEKVRHPTFAINLKHRSDRREHIVRQFLGLECFDFEIIDAVEDVVGAVGLWRSIVEIVRRAEQSNREYVIICEDDHVFTPDFDPVLLAKCIDEGSQFQADIIIGGASAIYSCCKVSDNLIWMESFTGTQFVIVFAKFFQQILNCKFERTDSADFKLTALTNNTYCIFPFFSVQKEFGYSDVTTSNSAPGQLLKLFSEASGAVQFCLERFDFFKKIYPDYGDDLAANDISLYTFILEPCGSCRIDIWNVVKEREEFDVIGSLATEHEIGDFRAVPVLQKAVTAAIAADEDLLVIIDSKHIFTESYSRQRLIGAIVDANEFGADFLLGGATGGFTHALPATGQCFWINDFHSTNFIVLFRKFFDKILSIETCEQNIHEGNFLATLTSNAFLAFPFFSNARFDAFGTSNLPDINFKRRNAFETAEARMLHIRETFDHYRRM